MNSKTIASALAGLASATLTIGCTKTTGDATEVPTPTTQSTATTDEHACGNHAEGACGAGEADADPALATSRSFEIVPGQFAEANLQMTKGSEVTIRFQQGSAEIAWDVHSHDHSGGTQIHDQGTSGDGVVKFVAPEDGVFSILWKNAGAEATPLEVSISLGEGASLHSWMPAQ